MSERYDSYTLVKCGSSEEESLKKLVAFLNRSYLKKDSAIDYLKIVDYLTPHKMEAFEVLCEDYENDSTYTYKATIVNNHYRLDNPEFTGEDLHKCASFLLHINV